MKNLEFNKWKKEHPGFSGEFSRALQKAFEAGQEYEKRNRPISNSHSFNKDNVCFKCGCSRGATQHFRWDCK